MTTIQKLFVLSFFAFIALFSQTTADAAGYLKFDGIDGESYVIERVKAPPADGKHLVATHKKSGGKLMILARGGKIQRMYVQSVSGKTKTLEASTAGCSQGGLCTTFQIKTCFTLPSGECVCVCGAWFADSSNGSTNTKPSQNTKVKIAGLPDGVNVIAQTREHILLAAIVEKGELVGMGSINPQGSFNRFTPDTPCSGYIVQPCADGSAPGSYYDNEGKCVAYCTGFIVIDPSIFKPVKSYGLRPNSPCSDWIAAPCGKGETLVSWYDYNTGKCVAICEPN
ncbi:MAG: hypothetical protein ACPGVB_14560 [Chitinophagales bacterium]